MTPVYFHSVMGPRENLEDAAAAVLLPGAGPRGSEVVFQVVCDGVGGRAQGEVASAVAVSTIVAATSGLTASVHSRHEWAAIRHETWLNALCQALSAANQAILDQITQDRSLAGMATTAVCVLIIDRTLYVAWAGDSRCYVYSQGCLRLLSRDHSEVAKLVALGLISPQEACTHPLAHTITRYLGQAEGFAPEARLTRLKDGDIIMLTTDGLTEVLSVQDIERRIEAVQAGSLPFKDLPSQLVDDAITAGTTDNATVLCCQYEGSGQPTTDVTFTGDYALAAALALQQMHQEGSRQ
jgi:PPM family protein phosphatase